MRRRRVRKPRPPRPNPRTRIRRSDGDATIEWMYYHTPGLPPVSMIESSVQVHKYDFITSYVGSKSLWNPVTHRRVRGQGGTWSECKYASPPDYVHLAPVCPSGPAYLPVSEDTLLALRPTVKPNVLQSIQIRGLTKATVMVPTGTSVANFLIELREGVRGIVPRLRSFKDCLGSLYLGLKFGTESFLRDLKGLYTTWGKFQKRLSYLRKNNGSMDNWVREYRKEFELYEYDIPQDIVWMPVRDELGSPIHRAVKYHVVPESIVTRVQVNLLTYFLLEGLETFWGKMDAFSAAFGLNNPAKIAWNAAKMTWLVEYFINVSPWLDKLAGKPFKGNMELRAVWCSVRTVYRVEVYEGRLGGEPGSGSTEDSWYCSGWYVVRCYDRYPGLDIPEDELVGLDLTDQQKTILAALAESRVSWDRTPWTKWAARKWGPWLGGSKPRLGFRIPPRTFRKRFLPRRRSSR